MFAAMSPDERARALKANPVFAGLPVREIDTLAAADREEPRRARDDVFMEGDPAQRLCIVKSGRIRIIRRSRAGNDVVLELLGPGEVFGGPAVRRQYVASRAHAARCLSPLSSSSTFRSPAVSMTSIISAPLVTDLGYGARRNTVWRSILQVEGPEQHGIFRSITPGMAGTGGH
jgi:Cyclic nucleotide-binding domain